MKQARDAVVVTYGRTPMARANKGSFAGLHPVEYAGECLAGVLDKLEGLDRSLIDDVITGCAMPEKKCFWNIGRLVAQRAGLPDSVTGMTVNRFCSSGLQAIALAADAINAGRMDIVCAGGVEYMTGMDMNPDLQYADEGLVARKPDSYISMGMTAENVAEQYDISRVEMEREAVESHAKAHAAQEKGLFRDEIIPIHAMVDGKEVLVTEDEGIRPGTSLEGLAKLKPCFKENGRVTAAISSQMTDGAGYVVLMARETAEKLGYRPIARFVTFAVGGVPAGVMGLGPIKAVPKALKQAGIGVEDLDVIELNEAFASQMLACIRTLKLPKEKVNPNGGAMALGHPLGATGAFLSCKVLNQLRREGGKYGLVTMCIGGGQGAAGIYEMEE